MPQQFFGAREHFTVYRSSCLRRVVSHAVTWLYLPCGHLASHHVGTQNPPFKYS